LISHRLRARCPCPPEPHRIPPGMIINTRSKTPWSICCGILRITNGRSSRIENLQDISRRISGAAIPNDSGQSPFVFFPAFAMERRPGRVWRSLLQYISIRGPFLHETDYLQVLVRELVTVDGLQGTQCRYQTNYAVTRHTLPPVPSPLARHKREINAAAFCGRGTTNTH